MRISDWSSDVCSSDLAAPQPAAEAMESVGMSANLLISIIDDDESAREAVVGLVRALGFTATEFQSAAEFLKSSHLLQPACLIADMRMPGMTGLELYRHLIAVDRQSTRLNSSHYR